MDKYSDSRSSRSRWKDDNRNPKLYDERTDKAGVTSSVTNGKVSSGGSSKSSNRLSRSEIANQINQNLPEDVRI